MAAFKERLAAKVKATHAKAAEADHSPFLRAFGEFRVPKLHETEVPLERYIAEMLESVSRDVRSLKLTSLTPPAFNPQRLARDRHSAAGTPSGGFPITVSELRAALNALRRELGDDRFAVENLAGTLPTLIGARLGLSPEACEAASPFVNHYADSMTSTSPDRPRDSRPPSDAA